jgi:hypothetical protein
MRGWVLCIDDRQSSGGLRAGAVYFVRKSYGIYVTIDDQPGRYRGWLASRFKSLNPNQEHHDAAAQGIKESSKGRQGRKSLETIEGG